MPATPFSSFFQGNIREFLIASIRMALLEDGPDLTTNAVFSREDTVQATILAKQNALVAGLPFLSLVLEETALREPGQWKLSLHVGEGDKVSPGTILANFSGSARVLLRAERVMLNFLCHLSGIATLVNQYVCELEGTGVCLLDTRKTLPGLRYPEKYAVVIGGGVNHRKNLSELLMLKDNHVDAAGSITKAIACLIAALPGYPVEVECSTIAQVHEAVACNPFRIMLDNMSPRLLAEALPLVPQNIEVEVSGNVTLENIRSLALASEVRKPQFISVGRITHSAAYADFSMRISK